MARRPALRPACLRHLHHHPLLHIQVQVDVQPRRLCHPAPHRLLVAALAALAAAADAAASAARFASAAASASRSRSSSVMVAAAASASSAEERICWRQGRGGILWTAPATKRVWRASRVPGGPRGRRQGGIRVEPRFMLPWARITVRGCPRHGRTRQEQDETRIRYMDWREWVGESDGSSESAATSQHHSRGRVPRARVDWKERNHDPE
jgi:hypothetical protein